MGPPIVYVKRRILPQGDELPVVQEHVVTEGERLDHLAAQYLGDPEQDLAYLRRQQGDAAGGVGQRAGPARSRSPCRKGWRGRPDAEGRVPHAVSGTVSTSPVAREVIDALTSVEVTSATDGPSGFQLSFTLSQRSPLHREFLIKAGTNPLLRMIIVVTIQGTPDVLMDGVITNQQVSSGSQPGESILTMTGEDLSKVMDLIDFERPAVSGDAGERPRSWRSSRSTRCSASFPQWSRARILDGRTADHAAFPRRTAPISSTSNRSRRRRATCSTSIPVPRGERARRTGVRPSCGARSSRRSTTTWTRIATSSR